MAWRRMRLVNAFARMLRGSRSGPKWLPDAERLIKEWFVASDYCGTASIRGGDSTRMIANCLGAFCSAKAFAFVDKLVRIICNLRKCPDIQSLDGVLWGCDWGYTALHLAQAHHPRSLLAVDVTGKYGYAARAIQEKHPAAEGFQSVTVLDAGPWGIRKHWGTADFLIVTRSFPVLDNVTDRKELLSVLRLLRPGGTVLYYPPRTPGHVGFGDLQALLAACGFGEVALLDGSGRVVSDRAGEDAYFIAGRRMQDVAPESLDEELAKVGQDELSLLCRRPPLDYPPESIVRRIDRVVDAIQLGRTELETLPLRYTLNVTSLCNIKCIFCDYPDRLRHWALPESLLRDVLETLGGTLRVQLTGGEPLINNTARRIIQRAARMPYLQLEIISNMAHVRPEVIREVAEGASFLTCSMDAATKETYDTIRQNSNWDEVIRNLETLVALKRQNETLYPHVQINFIIMGHNVHEIAAFTNLAANLGVDSVAYKWLLWTLTPRITEEAKLDVEDEAKARLLCEQLWEATRLASAHGIKLTPGPVPYHVRSECPASYEEYDMDGCIALANDIPWLPPKEILAKTPRRTAVADISPEDLHRRSRLLDRMPDGLMCCSAPFSTLQINGPQFCNFCCYSTPEYRSIPLNSAGALLDAWNHPKFQEARRYFLEGAYEKVCRPHCSVYREYLARAGRAPKRADCD